MGRVTPTSKSLTPTMTWWLTLEPVVLVYICYYVNNSHRPYSSTEVFLKLLRTSVNMFRTEGCRFLILLVSLSHVWLSVFRVRIIWNIECLIRYQRWARQGYDICDRYITRKLCTDQTGILYVLSQTCYSCYLHFKG